MAGTPVQAAHDFPEVYAGALQTQQWESVAPLMHPSVCVTFSNGAFHAGVGAVEAAYRKNFSLIQDEVFRIFDLHWVHHGPNAAAYAFGFEWSGIINGESARGNGRGTALIVLTGEGWKLIAEHLGPAAATR